MFNFRRKDSKDARSNTVVVEEMVAELDSLVDSICKATNSSVWDLVGSLDETTGAILGSVIKSSNKMLGLAYEQAQILDRYEKKINDLEDLNMKMLGKIELLLEK